MGLFLRKDHPLKSTFVSVAKTASKKAEDSFNEVTFS